MAVFITGILLFLALALLLGWVHLAIVRRLAGKEFRVSPRSFAYGMLIPIAVGLVFLGVGAFLEYHEQPEFCGEMCHSMEPKYNTYVHPENNSMMITHKDNDVGCTGCHVGPGWWGQVKAYWAVPHEVISELFDTYDPEDLGGHLEEEQCLKCHDGSEAVKPGEVTSVLGTQVDPHTGIYVCFHCHPAHTAGFGVSLDTCQICHGEALTDWNASMERHGNRTGGECLDCHDRAHPEDARVPWTAVEGVLDSEFCADCHPPEYDVFIASGTEGSHELYGECLDCHHEHDVSLPFHIATEPYQNCSLCHMGLELPGGIHNRTGVTYSGVANVGNDLCAVCHVNETAGLDADPQHRGLFCTYCHLEHLELAVDFTRCTLCHRDNIPDWHASDTTGCTKGACHKRGWYH